MKASYSQHGDGYWCYDHTGAERTYKATEDRAQAWVDNWNTYNIPPQDILAPTTTCTSNAVPCEGPDPNTHDTVNFNWVKRTNFPWGWRAVLKQEEKGNNPMYIDDCACSPFGHSAKQTAPKNASGAGAVASVVLNAGPDTEQEQRKHLERRAHDVRYAKFEELNKQFFISEPNAPKTAKEVADRLKAGQYTVKVPKNPVDDDDNDDDDFGCFYWRDVFSWRTPETQPDKAGYKAAAEEFEKFYADTIDTISIVSPVEGLAALRALQNWKPASTGIVAKILG